MSPEILCSTLKQQFEDAVVRLASSGAHPHAVVGPDRWREIASFLRDEPRLRFNMLRSITALDLPEDNRLAAVYDLLSMHPSVEGSTTYTLWHEFAIRIEVDRDAPVIPSVAHIWPAADWHEREAYDLMGIVFDGHPDNVTDHDGTHPRRILCPDDWVGYPLRKDYKFPMEYHGIPGTTEYELTSPKH